MEEHKLYAIIDGALEADLQLMLERYNPPHCCLYAEPVQPELLELAPWLVMVDQQVEAWLGTRETPWGIYIYSKANIKSLRQHLRKYLHVLLPDQENQSISVFMIHVISGIFLKYYLTGMYIPSWDLLLKSGHYTKRLNVKMTFRRYANHFPMMQSREGKC
ncbi:DUF4123 domain-containing protein [Serratia sp. 3ACOL1]|uniref:DUF4123 domain-containing protein n=1 Tax=Serratia sp. 3ACOL1 TaxID=2448483 RepID=UPI000EF4B917|nr:DUF4123 domain-containing protein [Serratia sp. 3ACOL1]AYM91222.1 DUF4123 domain-containing protein [Serratia sp. 3ACOL1]